MRAQVGNCVVENLFRVFSAATARRRVERVDWLAIVSRNQAARFVNSARREWIYRSKSAIDLRARSRQDVEPLRQEPPAILECVGARRDRLGLQRFDGGITAGRKLVSNNATNVVFESELVYDCEIAAQVCEHFDPSAERSIVVTHRGVLLVVRCKRNRRTRAEDSSGAR